MSTQASNPYVGLRPFDVDESLLFFGRKDQIMELLQQLHNYHFVAVVGSSGCGKSSLLRAGVIPALKAGYLVQGSDQWYIGIMRPGQNPLHHLVQTILGWENQDTNINTIEKLLKEIEVDGITPLLQLLEKQKKQQNKNFFLLVDQFEELFRFTMGKKGENQKDEANDFVNLILELSRQRKVPFHVVITMRSDFMGDCTKFYGLPEAMNKSLFLVPRLNRVQMKMAIEGPAKLYGGKLNPVLVSRLLNDVGKYEDELPLLQHALMRIWDHETQVDRSGELDMQDYNYIGGMQEALSKHADEALGKMSKKQFAMAKEIFQALTMVDEHGRKTRRPVLLSQLILLTGASEVELLEVIRRFIADKRSFLIINEVVENNDKVIDISHESLIREWRRLDRWMDEEAESASIYIRLTEAALLHEQNKKDFLSGSELQLALEWKNKFKPKADWANRYVDGFDRALSYLQESEKNDIENRRHEEERQRQELRSKKRVRSLFVWLGTLVFIAGMAMVASIIYKKNSDKNQKMAEAATRFASLRDSIAFVAEAERDETKAQLETLKNAQDSIQNIIAQSNADYIIKNRLAQVSTSLNVAIKQSEADIRKKELQISTKNNKDATATIKETLESLREQNILKMTPEELVRAFNFLNRTKKEVWTPTLIKLAQERLNAIENDIKSGKILKGLNAPNEMIKFKSYLGEIEKYNKSMYSKKAAN
ncbi:hypothetical protein [uncultured Kriegella sp.]|uniref:nSTAND1 domain-containing NTPase n=1 Tax=uncultured Kriegella sp. TaxID=1798910 RepID=UPI0030D70811|tara:strand:+ start:13171 stop:15297 length:2127 start_codon:yes stop_codon:yes gene_type:complete